MIIVEFSSHQVINWKLVILKRCSMITTIFHIWLRLVVSESFLSFLRMLSDFLSIRFSIKYCFSATVKFQVKKLFSVSSLGAAPIVLYFSVYEMKFERSFLYHKSCCHYWRILNHHQSFFHRRMKDETPMSLLCVSFRWRSDEWFLRGFLQASTWFKNHDKCCQDLFLLHWIKICFVCVN